ncbi:MAG: hypothetical protein WA395_12715 [Nitrososphaeraceae archaeon]
MKLDTVIRYHAILRNQQYKIHTMLKACNQQQEEKERGKYYADNLVRISEMDPS